VRGLCRGGTAREQNLQNDQHGYASPTDDDSAPPALPGPKETHATRGGGGLRVCLPASSVPSHRLNGTGSSRAIRWFLISSLLTTVSRAAPLSPTLSLSPPIPSPPPPPSSELTVKYIQKRSSSAPFAQLGGKSNKTRPTREREENRRGEETPSAQGQGDTGRCIKESKRPGASLVEEKKGGSRSHMIHRVATPQSRRP